MDNSRIFIIGANGQLGLALQKKYPNARKADISELDITDKKSVMDYDWSNIDIILNAAAYTNVDGAETEEGRRTAWLVNVVAVSNLQQVSIKNDITLLHISTDYVFDGTKSPHSEYESFSPLSVYGSTKAAGDIVVSLTPKHYILRTSWVIGDGKNFVRTMLELGKKGVEPSVVDDQIGRLTFTNELVRAIDHILLNSLEYGIYNISNDGIPASWADITREIFKISSLQNNVIGISTSNYYQNKDNVALRPLKSLLDISKIQATGFKSTDWKINLSEYINKEPK